MGLTLATVQSSTAAKPVETAFEVFENSGFAGRRYRALLHLHFVEHLLYLKAPLEKIRPHVSALEEIAPNDPETARLKGLIGER